MLDVQHYRDAVVKEMIKLGAVESDIEQLNDEILIYAIENNRNPIDLAWALLQ